MTSRENCQIIQNLYAAYGRGDISGLLDMLSDEIEWHVPGPAPFAGWRHGRGEVARFFTELNSAVRVQYLSAGEFVAEKNKVVVLGRIRSEVKSTGAVYEQDWAHVFTLSGGKIVKVECYEDTAAQAEAFGENVEPAGVY